MRDDETGEWMKQNFQVIYDLYSAPKLLGC